MLVLRFDSTNHLLGGFYQALCVIILSGSSTGNCMRIYVPGGYVSTPNLAGLQLLQLADLHIQPPIPLSNMTTCSRS